LTVIVVSLSETKKPPLRGGFSKVLEFAALWTKVTGY